MPDSLRLGRLLSSWPLLFVSLCHAHAQERANPIRKFVLVAGIGSGRIQSFSFSPDGRFLAVLTNVGFRVLETESGQERNSIVRYQHTLPENGPFSPVRLCWSPDGRRIAVASRALEIWDPFGKAPERTLPLGEDTPLHDLTWSPSGDRIAARTSGASGIIIDVRSGKRRRIPERSDIWENGPSWSPDGHFVATIVESKESETIQIWDASRLELVRQVPLVGLQKYGHGQREVGTESSFSVRDPSLVAWAPKGDVLAVDSGLTGLSLWSASNGKFQRQFSQGNRFLSWSRDGTVVLVQAEHQIRSFDRFDGSARVVSESEDIFQGAAVVSPDGRYVAAYVVGRRSDEIDVWPTGRKEPLHQIPSPPQFDLINYGQSGTNSRIGLMGSDWVSPDGLKLVVESDAQTQILDIKSGRPVLPPLSGRVWIAWSGSERLILAGHYAGAGRTSVFRVSDGRYLSSFQPSGFAALSPKEDLIAIAGNDGVHVIRVDDGAVVETIKDFLEPSPRLSQYMHRYRFASWSPNGRRILLEGSWDSAIDLQPAIFSLEDRTLKPAPGGTGRLLWVGPQELVRTSIPETSSVLQSPDLRLGLTIPHAPGPSQLWDLRTGKEIASPAKARGGAVWSPDSTRIAYVTAPGKVDIWDVRTGKIMETWQTTKSWQAFGAQGTALRWPDKLVFVEGMGGAVRLWRQP
jgi:WD40 repeat protein